LSECICSHLVAYGMMFIVIASGMKWSEAICQPVPSLRSDSCRSGNLLPVVPSCPEPSLRAQRSNLYPVVPHSQTGLPLSDTDCHPSKPDKLVLPTVVPRNDGTCRLCRPVPNRHCERSEAICIRLCRTLKRVFLVRNRLLWSSCLLPRNDDT